MNIKIYNATVAHLRAQAMSDLIELEACLSGPPSEGSVARACECAQDLVQSEGALLTLQQYFKPPVPQPATPPPPPAAPAGPPVKITPEMSSTYKKSLVAEEKRKKAEEEKIASESKPKAKSKSASRRKKG